MVAIAVAVTVATAGALIGPSTAALGTVLGSAAAGAAAGAAGSVASQAFGVATGMQDSFDWKGARVIPVGAGYLQRFRFKDVQDRVGDRSLVECGKEVGLAHAGSPKLPAVAKAAADDVPFLGGIEEADLPGGEVIKSTGRIGRSLGCPAIEMGDVPKLIPALQGGSLMILWKSR